MSTETETTKIGDRPFPFEVKTALLQLVGLAISTPKDVADIQFDFDGRFGSLTMRVFPGGYSSDKNQHAFTENIYFTEGEETSAVLEKLGKIIVEINQKTADGRKIKAQRIRDQIAELQKKAEALEGNLSATQP